LIPLTSTGRRRKIRQLQEEKLLLINSMRHLNELRKNKRISFEKYRALRFSILNGQTLSSRIERIDSRIESLKQPQIPPHAYAAAALLVLLLGAGLFLEPRFTGFLLYKEIEQRTDPVGLTFSENSSFVFSPSASGVVRGLRVSGRFVGSGYAKVWAVVDGKRYLVFSKRGGSVPLVTGNVVGGGVASQFAVVSPQESFNASPQAPSANSSSGGLSRNTSSLLGATSGNVSVNGTLFVPDVLANASGGGLQNLTPVIANRSSLFNGSASLNMSVEGNVSGGVSLSAGLNRSLVVNGSNVSVNVSGGVNASENRFINLSLVYGDFSGWDDDNDGVVGLGGVVDFSVAGSSFSWGVDESKLCTLWSVFDLGDGGVVRRCFGSSDCCAFSGLRASRGRRWDDPYFLYYGYDGAGFENEVSAVVVYYDVPG